MVDLCHELGNCLDTRVVNIVAEIGAVEAPVVDGAPEIANSVVNWPIIWLNYKVSVELIGKIVHLLAGSDRSIIGSLGQICEPIIERKCVEYCVYSKWKLNEINLLVQISDFG